MAIDRRYVKRRSAGEKKTVRVSERRDGLATQHRAKAIIVSDIVGVDDQMDLLRSAGMSRCVSLTNNVGGQSVEPHAAWEQGEEAKQPRTTLFRRKSGKPAYLTLPIRVK
jgi:hypothetical protein